MPQRRTPRSQILTPTSNRNSADRRTSTGQSPGARPARRDAAPAVDEDRAATLARAAMLILQGEVPSNRAPGIRTSKTDRTRSKRDVESMAQDLGMGARDLDARREAEDEFERVARGLPTRRTPEQRDASRGLRRASRGVIRRQFTEMRGRKITASTMNRSMSLEDIVSDKGCFGIGEADVQFLFENGIGTLISRWVGYMAKSGMEGYSAARAAFDEGEDDRLVRTLAESTLSTGGVLVPEEVSEDYIELLYAATVYLQAGPLRMTLNNGVLTLPRIASGGTVGWIGENQNAGKTAPSFDAPRLVLRYLAALVPWANRLAAHSPHQIAQIVMEDLVNQASELIDVGCLRGTGTSYQPLGLELNCPADNKFSQSGTSVSNITADHAKLFRAIEDAKVKMVRPAIFMAPRTRWALMAARDGNNNLIWAGEMASGKLWGRPFFVTTNMPTNLGGGTNESKIIVAEMSQEIYAEGAGADGLRIDTRDGVAYHDGSSVVSAFSQDQTVTRIVQSAERASRHGGLNIAILEGVTIA